MGDRRSDNGATMELEADDWVQALGNIRDDDYKYARMGSLGRVEEVYEDGTALVYWERTGLLTLCFPHEFERVSGPETKPLIGVIGEGAADVVEAIKDASEFADAVLCETQSDTLTVRKRGGAIWGVKRKGGSDRTLGDVSEYLYPSDSAEDLQRIVRWKLRNIAPWVPIGRGSGRSEETEIARTEPRESSRLQVAAAVEATGTTR